MRFSAAGLASVLHTLLYHAEVVEGQCKPFSYLPKSEIKDDKAYGLEDWDEVERSCYFIDWNRYYKKSMNSNDCSWKPNDGKHQQSPVDIRDWDTCDEEKDDKHRHVTKHGSCKWEQLNWAIKPYGLEMTLPLPDDSDTNPEEAPCRKPRFDSSGGYGNEFYMNYMMIKTPSEHMWKGERFEAEIQMGFYRYSGSDPSIFGGPPYTIHILVSSKTLQQDNPILQPYLDEWKKLSDNILNKCVDTFGYDPTRGLESEAPTVSPAPSMSLVPSMSPTAPKICATNQTLDSLTTLENGGSETKMSGIMFDLVSNTPDESLSIDAFDINIRSTSGEDIEIWTKLDSWTEADAATNSTVWKMVLSDRVTAAGADLPTRVALDTPIVISPGSTQAVYIVLKDDDDLYSIPFNATDVGQEVLSDSRLSVLVGQGIDRDAFEARDEEDYVQGLGFSGVIHYTACKGGREPTRRQLRHNTKRQLDHDYIEKWNDSKEKDPIDFSTKEMPWDPFRLWPSPWYARYRGSLTMPQCFDETRVRILDRPLQISKRQLNMIEEMIATMRDPETCFLATVGRPRADGSGFVDVARPIQELNSRHEMMYCDDGDFSHADFWFTPRGNTCWCLLDGTCQDGCNIDCAGNCLGPGCDSHWPPDTLKWTARRCSKS